MILTVTIMTVGPGLLIYLKTSFVAAVIMTANKLSVCGTICSNTTPKQKRTCNVMTQTNMPKHTSIHNLGYFSALKK